MVYYETFYSRSDAFRHEMHFNSMKGRMELKAQDMLIAFLCLHVEK